MGLFSFLNNKKKEEAKNEGFEFVTDFKKHLIDNLLIVNLPVNWIPYDSDRFRAKTNDGKLQMSLINYESQKGGIIDSHFFKDLKLHLYETFVTEGEYEPYEDLKVAETFITKSFKVDEETQYYYTTARNVNGRLIVTDIIVREIGDYDKKMQPTLQIIGDSIAELN